MDRQNALKLVAFTYSLQPASCFPSTTITSDSKQHPQCRTDHIIFVIHLQPINFSLTINHAQPSLPPSINAPNALKISTPKSLALAAHNKTRSAPSPQFPGTYLLSRQNATQEPPTRTSRANPFPPKCSSLTARSH